MRPAVSEVPQVPAGRISVRPAPERRKTHGRTRLETGVAAFTEAASESRGVHRDLVPSRQARTCRPWRAGVLLARKGRDKMRDEKSAARRGRSPETASMAALPEMGGGLEPRFRRDEQTGGLPKSACAAAAGTTPPPTSACRIATTRRGRTRTATTMWAGVVPGRLRAGTASGSEPSRGPSGNMLAFGTAMGEWGQVLTFDIGRRSRQQDASRARRVGAIRGA